MEVIFSPESLKDADYWKKSRNTKIQERITILLDAIVEMPFEGIGKPEPLKHGLSGCWSRRINQEHRLVYEIIGNEIHILSIKGHYKD